MLPYSGTNLGFGSIATGTAAWTYQTTFGDVSDWTGVANGFSHDAGNEEVDFNLDNAPTGSYQVMYHDLTSVSDTQFLLRFPLRIDNNSNTSSDVQTIYFIIGSTNDASTQDFLGFRIRVGDSATTGAATWGDGQGIGANAQNFATSFATTTGYNMQVKRTSATSFTVGLYDSSYTSLTEEEVVTIPSTIQSLRYVKFLAIKEATTNQYDGAILGLQFNNATVSPP